MPTPTHNQQPASFGRIRTMARDIENASRKLQSGLPPRGLPRATQSDLSRATPRDLSPSFIGQREAADDKVLMELKQGGGTSKEIPPFGRFPSPPPIQQTYQQRTPARPPQPMQPRTMEEVRPIPPPPSIQTTPRPIPWPPIAPTKPLSSSLLPIEEEDGGFVVPKIPSTNAPRPPMPPEIEKRKEPIIRMPSVPPPSEEPPQIQTIPPLAPSNAEGPATAQFDGTHPAPATQPETHMPASEPSPKRIPTPKPPATLRFQTLDEQLEELEKKSYGPEAKKPQTPSVPSMAAKTPEEILGLTGEVKQPPRAQTPPREEKSHISQLRETISFEPTPPSSLRVEGKTERPKFFQFAVIILGALIVVAFLGGFLYWKIFIQGRPAPVSPTPPTAVVATPPNPIFPASEQKIISIPTGREELFVEQIRGLEQEQYPPKTIVYLPIQKQSDKTFIKSKDFFALLNISLPQPLLDALRDRFMLYMYAAGEDERAKCQQENTLDVSCFSPRLGMVFQIKPGEEQAVATILKDEEPSLAGKMKSLILGYPDLEKPSEWALAMYINKHSASPDDASIPVRYVNLPLSTTALNYSIFKNTLVVATSKNSSYAALDELTDILSRE